LRTPSPNNAARLPEDWQEDFNVALWSRWFEARATEIERRRAIEADHKKAAEAREHERIRQDEIAKLERRVAEQEAKIKAQEGLVADCRARLAAVARLRARLWLNGDEENSVLVVVGVAPFFGLLAGMVNQNFWIGVGALIAAGVLVLGLLFLVGYFQKLYCEREWGETDDQLSQKENALCRELKGLRESLEPWRDDLEKLLEQLSQYWGRDVLESNFRQVEIKELEQRIVSQKAKIHAQESLVAGCRAKLVANARRRERLWRDEDERPDWLNATGLIIPLLCGVLGGIVYQGFWGVVGAWFLGWVLVLWFLLMLLFLRQIYCEWDWGETKGQLDATERELRNEMEDSEKSRDSLRRGLYRCLEGLSKYWDKERLESEISQRKLARERSDTQIRNLSNRLESIQLKMELGLWDSWEGWEKYWGRLTVVYIAIAIVYLAWLDESHHSHPGGVTWQPVAFAIPVLLNLALLVFFIQRKVHERSSGWKAMKEEERQLLDEKSSLEEKGPGIYDCLGELESELRSRFVAR